MAVAYIDRGKARHVLREEREATSVYLRLRDRVTDISTVHGAADYTYELRNPASGSQAKFCECDREITKIDVGLTSLAV